MTDTPAYAYDLFVAHAGADRAWVAGYLLPALGLPAARTQTPAGFRLGAPLVAEFERAVTSSRYTILVLSPAFLSDAWATFGDQLASYASVAEHRDHLIPLVLSPCVLPLRLDFRVHLDCTDPANWDAAAGRIRELIDQPDPAEARVPCPYPGMVPFKDAQYFGVFYGRDDEIQQIVQHLQHQRFLFVIGPSGCGKSSLIFAGVLPRVQRSSYWSPGWWLVREMHPGGQPLAALSQALEGGATEPLPAVTTLLAAHPPAQRLLLVIDQLEELFTQTPPDQQREFIAILHALQQVEACTLILALRADFYPDLMNSDLWPVAPGQRFDIAPLRGNALRAAIQQPAAAVGVHLEPVLLERLLADAADEPGVLPLVQETMKLLWDKRARLLLTLRAYEELGARDKDGRARSGLAVAIATKAEATLADLTTQQQQALARRIFLRLVQFGEGRADTRRQQSVAALYTAGDDPRLFAQTLRHLVNYRLLTQSGAVGGMNGTIDIAHEALISGWPRLKEWVDARRDAEQIRRRLEAQATEWVRLGMGRGGLLDESELPEAERWLSGPDAVDLGYSEQLQALIVVSRAALAEAAREKEAAHQRELEQVQALAVAQQQRADERAREARRLRRFVLGLLGLLLSLILVFWFALAQANIAHQESDARATAAAAQATSETAATAEAQNGANARASATAGRATADAASNAKQQTVVAASTAQATAQAGTARQTRMTLAEVLARQASVSADHDPQLSLLLAREAVSNTWQLDKLVIPPAEDALHQVLLLPWARLTFPVVPAGAPMIAAGWSPDGQRIVIGSADNTARIWDPTNGQQIMMLKTNDGSVLSATYSPDGRFILTAHTKGTAKIWDSSTGQLLRTLADHADWVNDAAWSPDGRRIATASRDGTAKVWEAATGQQLSVFSGHTGTVYSVAWNTSGTSIITAGADGTARVWDPATGQEQYQLVEPGGEVLAAAFNPRQPFIVTANADQSARIWGVLTRSTGPEAVLRGHTDKVLSVQYSPDGFFILTAGKDGTAKIWNGLNDQIYATLRGHTSQVNAAAYSPDGLRVVTASSDGTAKVWNEGGEFATLHSNFAQIRGVVYSPDGADLATADQTGTVQIWSAADGQPRSQKWGDPDCASSCSMNSVAYSPDGRTLAIASDSLEVGLWDLGGAPTRFLRDHIGGVVSVAWSPDGRRLATASADSTAKVWDVVTGKPVYTLRGHTARLTSVAWSLDGQRLLTTGEDGLTNIWAMDTGGELRSLQGPLNTAYGTRYAATSAAFSADGHYIATANADMTITVWDAQHGEAVRRLAGHTDRLNSVAWSPDGQRILTSSNDDTGRVWDWQTGEVRSVLRGHTAQVYTAVYSRDGRRIATASGDGTVRQYATGIDDLLALASGRITRGLTPAERTTYLGGLNGGP